MPDISHALETFSSIATSYISNASEAARQELLASLRTLSHTIETPLDAMRRLENSALPLVMARIGVDMGLFRMLDAASGPLTTKEVSQQAKAAPLLTSRILRYLASVDLIQETGQDLYTVNKVTKYLAMEGFEGAVHHYNDMITRCWLALPDVLQENGYQDLDDPTHCALNKAFNTPLPGFAFAPTLPDQWKYFQDFMSVQRMGLQTWLDVYPWQQAVSSLGPGQPLFVDIGGGIGHQCLALRKKVPELPNDIVVQDMAQTLPYAIKHPGIKAMEQDFFQQQTIKGAKVYYLRNIMHDWPDDKAEVILKNTAAAVGPDSVILIDDIVVPNVGAHWRATSLDMNMMAGLAARERTEDNWRQLISSAGLRINNIYTYTPASQDSIIECVPVDRVEGSLT